MFKPMIRLITLGALISCTQMEIGDSTESNEPNISDSNVQVVRSSSNELSSSNSENDLVIEKPSAPSFTYTANDPLSTFALDVDKGSYTLFKKYASQGSIDKDYFYRAEEFVNYFDYEIESASTDKFISSIELSKSYFRENLYDLRFTLASPNPKETSLTWNLTLVIDISGSMQDDLDDVKLTLAKLVDKSKNGDFISIVTYSGNVNTLLEPTQISNSNRSSVKAMLNHLSSDGSTYMSGGVDRGYEVNNSNFIQGGINRVIICSDGDANVGSTHWEAMLVNIKKYKLEGIFLTNLGFGGANYNETNMEQLADKGNGNYYYLSSESDIENFINNELKSATEVFAIDAKVQLAFDSTQVLAYRLRGYTNRGISDEDFQQDSTDAGEIGYGHQVTALYEIILKDNININKSLGNLNLKYKNIEYQKKEEIFPLTLSIPKADYSASMDQRFIVNTVEYVEAINNEYNYSDSSFYQSIQNLSALDLSDAEKKEFIKMISSAH